MYEAEGGGRLFCVSCSPSSANRRPSTIWRRGGVVACRPGSRHYAQQWVSEDGARVVFESAEPLVANDTNGKVDVYEWERDGTGKL